MIILERNYHRRCIQISKIIFNDKPYNPLTSTGYNYDIALLILKESVTISAVVLPACFRGDPGHAFDPGAGTPGLVSVDCR